mgnify:CR=1 FL=1
MKKPYLLLLTSLIITLGSCSQNGTTTLTSIPTSDTTLPTIPTSETTTSSSPTSLTSETTIAPTSESTTQTTTTPTSTTTSPQPQGSGIAEALAKGEALKSSVPSGSHEFFSTEEVTIKGRVIQDINIYLSQYSLTYLCDGAYMIPVLNAGTSQFHKKIQDYIGKETSNYIITGKIGYYYSQPCISLVSFEFRETMTFNIDYSTLNYVDYSTITSYVDYCTTIDYNKKGSGVSNLVNLKGVKCIAKADNNSWLFSDGTSVQGGYMQTSNIYFTVGKYYDLQGFSHVIAWKPSINVLTAKARNDLSFNVDIPSLAVSKTSKQMYSIGAPKDDVEKSTVTNNFLKTFQYFYKAENQYFNAYQVDSNYFVVSNETYYSEPITSANTASDKNMFKFNNPNYKFQYTTGDIGRLAIKDYIFEDLPLTMYFCEYQFTTINKREVPQVYMFEEYVPKLSFPESELRSFFSGQSYLFNENIIPMPYFAACVWYVIQTSGTFITQAIGVTQSEYNDLITSFDNNSNLVRYPARSTTTHLVWKHSQANPKFYYGLEYNSISETLTIDITKS